MTGREGTGRIAVRLLAAFALVFLSFAHKPVPAKVPSPALAANYLLPDGTFADICFGKDGVDHDAGRGKPPSIAPVCEACRLAASVLLPVPPQEALRAENGSWLATPPIVATEATGQSLRLLPPSRGPPRLS